ncbi:MAG: glycosyltransferase family 9 protein [Candidatus Nanopelagicaceae bacterium]|nr:glycosyltransferase family 9 protein [Candidatus Nanopelagicaceae bacterium]
MSHLVLTIAMGDLYRRFGEVTHPSIKAYADKIGADFLVIDKQKISQTTPHYEKFQIYELLNKYDRILYLDTDLIVRPDCPDLFQLVPPDQLGAFNEGSFADRSYAMMAGREGYGIQLKKWNGRYYNTGVLVVSRRHKQLFKKPEVEKPIFWEQTWLNMLIAKEEVEVFQLPYRFNRMTVLDAPTGEERHASYIVHYAGAPDMEMAVGLARKDLEKWVKDAPNYQYKRHILIEVQCGLGDQVQAEPTIRYLLKHVYPNEDVRVVTHFPILFRHLPIPVFLHGEAKFEPDCPYWRIITLPGPDLPMWRYVSNTLCHTIDYISMAVLRRTLPDADKEIHLTVLLEDLQQVKKAAGREDLKDLIVVHPGRNWESKTMPVEWWQAILDGLVERGMTPCVVGRECGGKVGVLDVVCNDKMVDLRNLLSLGELIALISQAKVLISNDSAPIHIAGAFENHIILIPTCKHPDHLLPWRRGRKDWRAEALYERLVIDDIPSAPTTIEGSTADKLPKPWAEYLPEPERVVRHAVSAFERRTRGVPPRPPITSFLGAISDVVHEEIGEAKVGYSTKASDDEKI